MGFFYNDNKDASFESWLENLDSWLYEDILAFREVFKKGPSNRDGTDGVANCFIIFSDVREQIFLKAEWGNCNLLSKKAINTFLIKLDEYIRSRHDADNTH